MPFAEVGAAIADIGEELGDGDFFGSDGPAGGEGAHAVRMPTGEKSGAGGGAAWVGGVEAVEAQTRGGHFIEHRGFNMSMAVVARFLPTVIVAHHEDDVGFGLGFRGCDQRMDEGQAGEGGEDGVSHGEGC